MSVPQGHFFIASAADMTSRSLSQGTGLTYVNPVPVFKYGDLLPHVITDFFVICDILSACLAVFFYLFVVEACCIVNTDMTENVVRQSEVFTICLQHASSTLLLLQNCYHIIQIIQLKMYVLVYYFFKIKISTFHPSARKIDILYTVHVLISQQKLKVCFPSFSLKHTCLQHSSLNIQYNTELLKL